MNACGRGAAFCHPMSARTRPAATRRKGKTVRLRSDSVGWAQQFSAVPAFLWTDSPGERKNPGKPRQKEAEQGRGGVDKRTVCDTIFKPKAMTKPSGPRRDEREGTVRALRDTDPRATSPAARDERDVSPRYGRNEMCRMCAAGIIRVVPRSLRFAPVNGGEALLFYPERGADSPRRTF